MAEAASARTRRALELFAPLGPTYERYASLLSLGQDPRWRRFLVSRVDAGPGDRVLDVATGTGAVAAELLRQKGCAVVGVDQSREMLAVARKRLPAAVKLVEASAESLPFEHASFDALTVTYLLRYVADPAATLRELARVLRPAGGMAGLDFYVPSNALWRMSWRLYTRALMPGAGFVLGGNPWWRAGRFLGPNIEAFYRRWPPDRLFEAWREAGMVDVEDQVMSLGGGLVMWGQKQHA